MSGVKPQWAAPTGADLAERSAKANTTGPSVGSAAGDDLAEGQHCSLVPLFIIFFIIYYYYFFLTMNLRLFTIVKESSSWPKAHAFNNPSCGL